MLKTPQRRTTFGSCDVEKVHAVVARSTFRSQNVKNTRVSDHFWRFRCRKSARRQDQPWQLLVELCGSAIWMLMGTSQSPQFGAKPPCLPPAEDHEPESGTIQGQEQGEGQDVCGAEEGVTTGQAESSPSPNWMLQRLAHLTLENPGNLCFANAATLAVMWTTLSTHTWQLPYWGEQCLALQGLLARNHDLCINLHNTEWFQHIVRCWGERDPNFVPISLSKTQLSMLPCGFQCCTPLRLT